MDAGTHKMFVDNETVYDTLRREWASKYKNISNTSNHSSVPTQENASLIQDQIQLPMGLALSKTREGG